ncbi:MAG: quinolinate synthase NadA [Candidatus Margulisbacteria bacterium]|nr:quinolinate synthase NadA [Candidatus Margulisiibacteriota bacterium]
MPVTEFTSNQLYTALKQVKLGGTTCLFTPEKCQEITPIINQINHIKKEKNAIILAHSYISPEIIIGVSDFVGDSYELSKFAADSSCDMILFCAVKFMADTAKILSPNKTVIIPSKLNGCSLADSITGEDVQKLRKQYSEYTFVCYINTTAEVKAACDVCVTSSNVYSIIEKIPNDKIYFLPDRLMGENVIQFLEAKGIHKDIKLWDGTCYVHEEYDPDMITYLRQMHKGIHIVSHPECRSEVINSSDFVGSTSQMMQYVKKTEAPAYFMLTECGLTSRLQTEVPEKTFVGSCTMCKYMKSNSLEHILKALQNPDPEDIIEIDPTTIKKAKHCISEMFRYVG